MAKYKVGLLVWAKMKSFPAWPGKVIEPEEGKKEKKKHQYIFFFGSENYAWVPEEGIFPYAENKERFVPVKRIPNGFKEAVDAIEDALKKDPDNALNATEYEVTSTTSKPEVKSTPKEKISASKTFSIKLNKKRDGKAEIAANVGTLQKEIVDSNIWVNTLETIRESEEEAQTVQFTSLSDSDLYTKVSKEKTKEKLSEKKKSAGRGRPRKRSISPESAPTPAKKGKILNKESAKSSVISSADTSGNQVHYSDFMSSLNEPKQSRAVSSSHSKTSKDNFIHDYNFVNEIPSKDSIIATPAKIGFLGLGLMGSGMVLNLLRSGHEVTVWNRTPSKCKDFIKDGALKGNSPSDVVQQCDITFSSVSDPAALKDLVFGNCGVLQGISEGKGFVDLSTIDVETAGDISEAIAARGGRFLEAPVIGSKSQASEGSLVVLTAGDNTLYQDCYSCFAAMGKKSFFLGETGAAIKMKLVLTLMRGTVIAGLAESLGLAEKVGLNIEEVMQILHMDPVACPLIISQANDMLNSNYNEPKSKLRNMQKDLRLSVNMSDGVDQPLHVGAAVNELFKKAKAKGYGDFDVTAVYRAVDL